MQKEIVTAMAFNCEGVISGPGEIPPRKDDPVQVTTSVYRDGSRDVGCILLEKQTGKCTAPSIGHWALASMIDCPHLLPTNSREIQK